MLHEKKCCRDDLTYNTTQITPCYCGVKIVCTDFIEPLVVSYSKRFSF